MRHFLIALLLAASGPVSAQTGPSFDCARAATSTEFAVCDSARLSKLDLDMANLYQRAATRQSNPERFREHQLLWQRWRNICAGDVACLTRRYEQRIIDLAPPGETLPIGTGPTVTYRIRDGRSERVYPDGRIEWRNVATGQVGTTFPDGRQVGVARAQVAVDALPEFPPAASAWVSALESPLLATVDSLLPSQYHDDYRAAQSGLPLPDRMFRHVDSIRFLSSE